MKNFQLEDFEEQFLNQLSNITEKNNLINPDLFSKYNVKRGLRDQDGKGVLVGLTEIGEVHAYIIDENETIPVPGRLIYRGIDISDIVDGFLKDGRFGFEETCYLLLFGELPDEKTLAGFEQLLAEYRKLPDDFVRDMILKAPSKDMMNVLARSVLALYSFDDNADDTSINNVLKQCIRLIACFPLLAVYGYQAYSHYHGNNSLYIHSPRPDFSTAENVLHMLRPDSKFTRLEATLLDLALVLHAEHGGGNNSSFVTHVVTSSGSDTYSAIAAALGSLKGPRHGGANIKVYQMFEDMKQNIRDFGDDEGIENYLVKLVNKQAFDRSGLIYGIGHAVYSISDPRTVIFKEHIARLAKEKGLEDEYNLYLKVEEKAPEIIGEYRKMYKGVSANVDFYSGFVYRMLDIPIELFTPIFAVSRIAGWSAHRIEEIVNSGKIIRPAYKSVSKRRKYIPMDGRKGV
ncbi:citrate/2-methylcitrate synthase [Pelotomaculum terephthalicicum JT]|uniref:citrate/2-methylcitrate synthase n=1 Tax=Pelotomaculum terephthalicicum TaxID=206393 RepID=UPI0009D2FE26|nr:citrate/2-methylcitrate synthase [Pelotomaculum terephthalicicum]MCG9966461.1 citrate/2-methylcitrate synthase [Pelotomaculum terephthalicicum JT]OPY63398.1 MAG: Citrate synthase 2 [Pelotomaculum sp. PtaU1.Bin065]